MTGEMAHNILSPKKHIDKKYYAKLREKISKDAIEKFENGIILEDGTKCLPAKLEILNEREVNIIIKEGKYHQVKRMMHSINNEVVYLKRMEMGKIKLDPKLTEGEYRLLTDEEIKDITNKEI